VTELRTRTKYTYDALKRPLSRSYSNGDPTVTTTYDQSNCLGLSSCQNIGHPTSVMDAAGSESWAYQTDSINLRSVHVNQRTTISSPNNITKTSTYYLDLAGNLTSVTYPTGRIVNYTYDAADRPATAADSTNGITYAAAQSTPPTGCSSSGVCYTPQGSEYSAAIGKTSSFTGLNLSETYNTRLQPLEIKASSTAGNAFDISYSFVDPTTSGNAGHVNSISNSLNSSRSQIFAYDTLNRITTAGTTATSGTYCWGYQYNYDAWGNLLAQAGWSPSYNGCSEATMGAVTANGNNHISGFTYDASGNTLNDGTIAYTYDAESQIKTAAGVTYAYDGSGRRVFKSSGKLYWYGSGGEILAETDTSGNTLNEYIFFGGKRIAMLPAGGNAQFYAEDFLGSSRVITTNNGTVCYDADFDPYGGEHPYTNTCAQNYKFEGKERDTETGNDDFGARYYSERFGRWLSSDWSSVPVAVPYANLTNPQTLNLYAMVSDDPESFADLDGHTNQASYGNSGAGVQTCASTGAGASGTTASGCGNNASASQAQAQNQTPFNPTITYDKNLSAKDLAAAQSKVGGAVGLINSKWSQLSDQEKATIGNIKAIDVSGTAQRSYVQESTGKLTLTQDYVTKSSTGWLASAVGHDGEHVSLYNSGGIGNSRGIPAEVKAIQFQLQVGTKFGLSAIETKYLNGLIQNPSQLQKYINTPP
jgi:RHS repeat-associated protein